MKLDNCIVRSFVISTEHRDKTLYPNPSDFTYQLPVTLTNVQGVAVRGFKFGNETLVNQNNKTLTIYGDNGVIDGTIDVPTGDYSNDINSLLAAINTLLAPYQVQFSLDTNTQLVQLTFTGNTVSSYIGIQYNGLLKLLGYDTSIVLYRTSAPSQSQITNATMYQTTAGAANAYDTYKTKSVMVVRITDIEALLSNDTTTNRATAVLFNTADAIGSSVQQCQCGMPLLQIQARLQALRIRLLNMDGDFFDTVNNEAVIVLDLYCSN